MPAVTSLRLVNADVQMPVVDAVIPSFVHSSGRAITVHGTNFGPESRLFFCGSVLGQPPALSEWMWVYNNATRSRHPIQRVALVGLPNATGVEGLVTIDDKGHDITLCDAMRQKGYELSNCTVEESDFRKVADAELSGLLQFKYVNSSIITVTTPCLSQVCLRVRAFVVRVGARSVCVFARAHVCVWVGGTRCAGRRRRSVCASGCGIGGRGPAIADIVGRGQGAVQRREARPLFRQLDESVRQGGRVPDR